MSSSRLPKRVIVDAASILSLDPYALRAAGQGDSSSRELIERLRRVVLADEEYRLIHQCGGSRGSGRLQIYRACPPDKVIRAGDWIALSESYAEDHVRGDSTEVVSMMVDIDDVLWAGTDNNEWFYAPSRFAMPDAQSLHEALHEMLVGDVESLISLASEGVQASDQPPERHSDHALMASSQRGSTSRSDGGATSDGMLRHMPKAPKAKQIILSMIPRLKETFSLDWNDGIHGISHWSRVFLNGRLLADSVDVNPEIVAWFSFLHDIKRENDNQDPDHGARAAQFAHQLKREGTIRLSGADFERLCHAMEGHSDGHVGGDLAVQVCWDADRLDLGRVGMVPSPEYLSTSLAQDPDFLAQAYARSIGRKWSAEDASSDDEDDDWRADLRYGRR